MVLDLNIFVWKWSKIVNKKIFFVVADFALQNMHPDLLETSDQMAYR